jgi:small subunit ribosomal protein S16
MAVKIRLRRMGAKKKPFYRVVVADSRSPRDGRFIEELGWFDPLKDPVAFKLDVEAARKWVGNGAKPTDTAKALLKKAGVYDAPADDEQDDTPDEPATDEIAGEAAATDSAADPLGEVQFGPESADKEEPYVDSADAPLGEAQFGPDSPDEEESGAGSADAPLGEAQFGPDSPDEEESYVDKADEE